MYYYANLQQKKYRAAVVVQQCIHVMVGTELGVDLLQFSTQGVKLHLRASAEWLAYDHGW